MEKKMITFLGGGKKRISKKSAKKSSKKSAKKRTRKSRK